MNIFLLIGIAYAPIQDPIHMLLVGDSSYITDAIFSYKDRVKSSTKTLTIKQVIDWYLKTPEGEGEEKYFERILEDYTFVLKPGSSNKILCKMYMKSENVCVYIYKDKTHKYLRNGKDF